MLLRRDKDYMRGHPGCSECYDGNTGEDLPCPPRNKPMHEVLKENLAKNLGLGVKPSVPVKESVPQVSNKQSPAPLPPEYMGSKMIPNPMFEEEAAAPLPEGGARQEPSEEMQNIWGDDKDGSYEALHKHQVSKQEKQKNTGKKKSAKAPSVRGKERAGLYTLVNEKTRLFFIGHSDDRFALSRKLLSLHGNMPHITMTDHDTEDVMAVMIDMTKSGYTPTLIKSKALSA